MAAVTGILNQHTTAVDALQGRSATPMAAANGSTSGTSTSSSSSATISANDFLTLLVTEMKNQDPTADTDPNEYINQLVNVNSLEQLISINQTLSTDLTAPTSTGGTVNPGDRDAKATALNGANTQSTSAQSEPLTAGATSTDVPGAMHLAAAKLAPGNLEIPDANRSALRVAQSLCGELHRQQ